MPKKTLIVTAVIEIEADNFDKIEDLNVETQEIRWVFDFPTLQEGYLPYTYETDLYTAVFTSFDTKLIDVEEVA